MDHIAEHLAVVAIRSKIFHSVDFIIIKGTVKKEKFFLSFDEDLTVAEEKSNARSTKKSLNAIEVITILYRKSTISGLCEVRSAVFLTL